MIDYLNGILESKEIGSIVIEVNGIGYKVAIPISTYEKLPSTGHSIKIFIVEATSGMYGGVIYLYGFLTSEERDIYLLIKEYVPNTGAKKAMEYIDKVSKSFIDFKTAIISKNATMLHDIFGFTKKTADKLIAALKDKIVNINISGEAKWSAAVDTADKPVLQEAIAALIALGYKQNQARTAAEKAFEENDGIALEDLIKKSLKNL